MPLLSPPNEYEDLRKKREHSEVVNTPEDKSSRILNYWNSGVETKWKCSNCNCQVFGHTSSCPYCKNVLHQLTARS